MPFIIANIKGGIINKRNPKPIIGIVDIELFPLLNIKLLKYVNPNINSIIPSIIQKPNVNNIYNN